MISNVEGTVAQLLVRNRDILRRAVMSEAEPKEPLGERFRLLFEGIGLEGDLPELHGQAARPADVG